MKSHSEQQKQSASFKINEKEKQLLSSNLLRLSNESQFSNDDHQKSGRKF